LVTPLSSGYKVLTMVLDRYTRYEQFLNYPGDWGERAFRGWLVFELFHEYLRWPIKNIVFGERFDVLLINDDLKPVINIETKKPEKGLADYEDFKKRLPVYQTLYYAISTDGYAWLSYACADHSESIHDLKKSEDDFEKFLLPFWSKKYLYGD